MVSTNLGGDKTNWFTNKKVTHILEKEVERYVRTTKISYTYTNPSADYAPFAKRFKDWVRLYVPKGSELINIQGSEDETGTGEKETKHIFLLMLNSDLGNQRK